MANPIVVGDLRYKINVLKVIKTKVNSSFVLSYETLHNDLKASRKYVNGTKLINNDEIFNTRVLQFITYYRKDVDETCIIEFEDRKYKINFLEILGYNEAFRFSVELINT